jgi:hypothetical protein
MKTRLNMLETQNATFGGVMNPADMEISWSFEMGQFWERFGPVMRR